MSLERLQQQATQRFDQSIFGIRDSGIEGISEIADRVSKRIGQNELLIVGKDPYFNIPTITGFDLLEVEPAPMSKYLGIVVIDIPVIASAEPTLIQGDLARTISIADQYPLNGFQRRYRTVYDQALTTQTNWLTVAGAPEISHDPRQMNREDLLKSLLGESRYYSDVGFDDWQKVIKEYQEGGFDPSVRSMLDQLNNATGHFLAMRQRFIAKNHQIALGVRGPDYLTKMDANSRAEGMAGALLGASLYARGPQK